MMTREGIEEIPKISKFALPLLKDFKNENLLLEHGRTYSIKERSFVQSKINENKKYRELLKSDLEQFEELKKTARHTRWGYSALDFITTITFLNKINFPKIKQLSTYGADLLATNFSSFEELVQYRNFVYRKVIELIDLRIENYEKIIQDFDNNEIYSTLNPNLRNSFSEYFDEVSLPRKMKMELSKNNIAIEQINDVSYLPAYYLKTKNGTVVTIVLKNSAKKILEFLNDKKNFEASPLVLNAEFISEEISEIDLKENKAFKRISNKKGTIEWNGKTLKILSGKKILFEGTL